MTVSKVEKELDVVLTLICYITYLNIGNPNQPLPMEQSSKQEHLVHLVHLVLEHRDTISHDVDIVSLFCSC